jgi:hypothetical protein
LSVDDKLDQKRVFFLLKGQFYKNCFFFKMFGRAGNRTWDLFVVHLFSFILLLSHSVSPAILKKTYRDKLERLYPTRIYIKEYAVKVEPHTLSTNVRFGDRRMGKTLKLTTPKRI